MTTHEEIPVVEVHRENFSDLWPSLVLAIRTSTFVAIDTELSGLGDRKRLNAKSVEDRYSALYDVARSRAIVSLGLCCFKLQDATSSSDEQEKKTMPFLVQTFNIILLCSEDYMVEPRSLKFLVDHGFDFNRQYCSGIPFYRGSDQPHDRAMHSMRSLFTELVKSKKPVVLHNGLVDLVFLYYSFYTSLPSSMPTFVTDLSEVFSGGIFDTKYVAEFKLRFQASYLEYVFRKSQRLNRAGAKVVTLDFPRYNDSEHVTRLPCDVNEADREILNTELCENFAHHGWCRHGVDCKKSHDMDHILDQEEKVQETKDHKRKKRNQRRTEKRLKDTRRNSTGETTKNGDAEVEINNDNIDKHMNVSAEEIFMETEQTFPSKDKIETHIDTLEEVETNMKEGTNGSDIEIATLKKLPDTAPNYENPKTVTSRARSGGHRAGFDAFMTGFIFSHYLSCVSIEHNVTDSSEIMSKTFEVANKISLSAKDFPLLITKSGFSKTSKAHQLKYHQIFPLDI